MDSHLQLNALLAESGVSKIVYALVMPETEHTIDAVLDGPKCGLPGGRDRFHALFREAWTQKQDAVHEEFFHTWFAWSSPIVQLDAASFPFQYPTSGASEGLREAINSYAAAAHREGFEPRLHVFDGEYEGFAVYAAAAGIEVCSHHRHDWKSELGSVAPHDQWYVSQPSAVDGMVWDDFDAFAKALYEKVPTAELMLDLSYVGCVAREFTVNANHPNIAAIFLSLSKPAGVYYHRIGGMLSKHEYQGLFGNKWFKNVASLSIGSAFMMRYGVHELPRKYQRTQAEAVERANHNLGLNLCPADVVLLGIGEPSSNPSELERFLLRGPIGEQKVRVCLTPSMAYAIDPKLNPNVSARVYERHPSARDRAGNRSLHST